MPRVTVVIPCFNHGRYLDDAVASVLAQSLQDFEIIVVDDGSTDAETVEVLTTFRREKTRVIREKNRGPSAARNHGIREGTGDYIVALDADDKIGATYLEKAVNALDADEKVGIVYSEAEYFGAKQGPWHLTPFSFPTMLWDNAFFVTAMFRRRDWNAVGGFPESNRDGWEDWDFWLTLTERGVGVHQIPESLFSYRVTDRSRRLATVGDRRRYDDSCSELIRRHLPLYARHVVPLCANRQWLERREGAAARVSLTALTQIRPLSSYPRRLAAALKLLAWSALAPTRR